MSRSVMYPTDLMAILHRAGGDSRLFVGCASDADECQAEKKRPDGMVYYQRDVLKEPIAICRCSRHVMASEDKPEPDPWFEGRNWVRIGWKKLLRKICHNGNIPVPLRERVYRIAEKLGFTGFLTREQYWAMVL